MPLAITTLPEELVLVIFEHLHRLDELYAVMLTCKMFNRVSRDIPAQSISHIASRTGEFLPGLRPHSHFFLVATARRLSAWTLQTEERRARLKKAMYGGIDVLAELALEVVPISLEDIRSTWAWKTKVLQPVSEILDRVIGPTAREEHAYLTVCEIPSLALFAWAIYGELFDHSFCFDPPGPFAPLDSVTRFIFMIYCVPDVNSFSYMSLDQPEWFRNIDDHSGEKYQQLSLKHAMQEFLNARDFSQDITTLSGIQLSAVEEFVNPDEYSKESLFVQVVVNSGRKSVDLLRFAHIARLGDHSPESEALAGWLRETWSQIQRLSEPPLYGTIRKHFCANDPWLGGHVPSLWWDLQFTLWDSLWYPNQSGKWSSEDEMETAVAEAIKAISK